MTETQNTKQSNKKPYDLEDRTFQFAKRCGDFIKKLPRTVTNIEYDKQLIRSSGSQAANYIEANEAVSKKTLFTGLGFLEKKQKRVICG